MHGAEQGVQKAGMLQEQCLCLGVAHHGCERLHGSGRQNRLCFLACYSKQHIHTSCAPNQALMQASSDSRIQSHVISARNTAP